MKDKTISLRVDVPTYANMITLAHENKLTLTDFILSSINGSNKQVIDKHKNQIESLQNEIKNLKKELSKKPKEVIKEKKVSGTVEIKAIESKYKAEISDLNKKLAKDQQNQDNKLKSHIKDLENLNKKVKSLESSLKKETKRADSNSSTVKSLNGKLIHTKNRVKELSDFINALDIRQHEDNEFSIGGRTFSEGKKIKV